MRKSKTQPSVVKRQLLLAALRREGEHAYDCGLKFEDNPYGNGDLFSRCGWAAGYVDRMNENEG